MSSTESIATKGLSRTDSTSITDRFEHVEVNSEGDAVDQDEDMDDDDDDDECGNLVISRSPGDDTDVAVVKWSFNMISDASRSHPNIISW